MSKKYYLWTEGCQMNVADSRRVGAALERLGYEFTPQAEEADVIVLNTCVVRQSAEDRAYGRLHSLRPLKARKPDLVINLMGCLVGVRGNEALRERFPYVDVFSPPSDVGPLLTFLTQEEARDLEKQRWNTQAMILDAESLLPARERGTLVSAYVPVVLGCSHACTFCVIPSRRGGERSRRVGEIMAEVRALVTQGVREVTLLGQIVDRYGHDIPDGPNLAGLLRVLHELEGLERIRFLTSHPSYFGDELIEAVATLPKVMPHIEIPVQAGSDEVLKRMRRGYTQADYRRVVEKIRHALPECSIATDIIVGFPGETETQFLETYHLLAELRLDVAHVARYSPRPGTVAARRYPDDVSEEEKMRRFRMIERLQEQVAAEINARYVGRKVEVLFEEKEKGRWRGRTPTNQLVFVESEADLRGQILPVTITWSGPWSMQGRLS